MSKTVLFSRLALILAVTSLSACGDTRGERALSGAGIGAGAGAVTGYAVGGSVAGGALLGGLAGGAIGAVTDKDDINLDD